MQVWTRLETSCKASRLETRKKRVERRQGVAWRGKRFAFRVACA
jgi:hypothetical protein